MARIDSLGLIGKKVLVIFYDSATSTTRREGILIEHDANFIYIQSEDQLIEGIPVGRIVRIKEE